MSIWPRASSERVANSLEVHSAIALLLGGLIYILALTGTLSVFNHEMQRWEQPAAPEMSSILPDAAAAAAKSVFESEDVPTKHLYINFPQPDLPRTVITTDSRAFFANADGTLAGKEHFPWTQFLLDLHYYLHLPDTVGLTLVGALGVFLIALSMSGFMAHPRIFRDAFTFRRGSDRVSLADLHNRLSVWTAPFHISNALTGAILGLASILALAIAGSQFGGDTGKVFDPVFGGDSAPVEGEARLARIAEPLTYMNENFPDLLLTHYILHDPGTVGQHSTVIADHGNRLIFGEYYNFTAVGDYEGNVGISDGTVGQQIIGSIYNVHFGNWGGFPVKLAYLVFGLALCTIIASGMRIYFTRRRQRARAAPRLEAGWEGIVWGTPAVLALALLAAVTGVLDGRGLVTLFWVGLGLVVSWATVSGVSLRVRLVGKIGTTAFLLSALVFHSVANVSAVMSAAVLSVSPAMILTCAVIVLSLWSGNQATSHQSPAPTE